MYYDCPNYAIIYGHFCTDLPQILAVCVCKCTFLRYAAATNESVRGWCNDSAYGGVAQRHSGFLSVYFLACSLNYFR